MVKDKTHQLDRKDWLKAALNMCKGGIEGVKIAPLAADLGVTTGSFYWHFKNRQELVVSLLNYWEYEMTDVAIDTARQFTGSSADRIFYIMETVMVNNLACYDLPIWQWAQSDIIASRAFKRVLKKRFAFAAWMFSAAGFSREQAEIRGRMMVTCMMGESTLFPDSMAQRKEFIKLKHAILTAPEQ